MLVLSRHPDDEIEIGEGIVVKIVSVQGQKVRVGIEAPRGISVLRRELRERAPALRPVPLAQSLPPDAVGSTAVCKYDDCVENEEQTCHRWMTGECSGPKGQFHAT